MIINIAERRSQHIYMFVLAIILMSTNSEEREEIILRTYNTVWKIDRKIYSIEGIKLLFPVSPNEALYFAISMALSMLFIKVIPFYSNLHAVIKFILVPYGLMKFFTKLKLDGKLPHKFFVDYIVYLISPKKYARFAPIDEYKILKFSTPVVFRQQRIIDKTKSVISKNKKKVRK